jgi:hypothetical protein
VFLYLKGTRIRHHIQWWELICLFDMHAFSDADCAGDQTTRLTAGDAWLSKVHRMVVTSSLESKYMAMYACIEGA